MWTRGILRQHVLGKHRHTTRYAKVTYLFFSEQKGVVTQQKKPSNNRSVAMTAHKIRKVSNSKTITQPQQVIHPPFRRMPSVPWWRGERASWTRCGRKKKRRIKINQQQKSQRKRSKTAARQTGAGRWDSIDPNEQRSSRQNIECNSSKAN